MLDNSPSLFRNLFRIHTLVCSGIYILSFRWSCHWSHSAPGSLSQPRCKHERMPLMRWSEGWPALCLLIVIAALAPIAGLPFQVTNWHLAKGPFCIAASFRTSGRCLSGHPNRGENSNCSCNSCPSVGLALELAAPQSAISLNTKLLANSSRGSNGTLSENLPLWDRIFSQKFLFSEAFPAVVPPVEASFFARASLRDRMASRCLRDLGLLADGGITNMVTAAAAACIAALGSWRLLNLASRFLRNSATQVRLGAFQQRYWDIRRIVS